MAIMETHDWENPCLQMLHGNSMARFVVLNNMAYDVMENEELVVFSTNSPFTILYINMWSGLGVALKNNQAVANLVGKITQHVRATDE
jgi:hypothetical protein